MYKYNTILVCYHLLDSTGCNHHAMTFEPISCFLEATPAVPKNTQFVNFAQFIVDPHLLKEYLAWIHAKGHFIHDQALQWSWMNPHVLPNLQEPPANPLQCPGPCGGGGRGAAYCMAGSNPEALGLLWGKAGPSWPIG